LKSYSIEPIGIAHTPYKERGQAPRQSIYGKEGQGEIEIFNSFIEGIQGLEKYEYIIVLFYFDRISGYSLKATPPGEVISRGVFATRSPARPNHIGLSVLKLIKAEGNIIKFSGVDMLDGTPIIDIKPYVRELESK